MVPFLKGFLSNLTAVQSKQILRILSQMQDRGEIRNSKDFERKLADLASLIKKGELVQRTPLLVYEEGELLESDAMRTFLEYLRLDIEAALGETERLSNSMRAHDRILVKNYFDAIEAAVSDLEDEARAYEVLETQKFTGFSSVIKRYAFDGSVSVPGADTSDLSVSSLLVDGRGGEDLVYSPPGEGEPGIHLGLSGESLAFNKFDRVEILTDETTPQTALNTSTEDNIPINAIDRRVDTAWKHSVLLSEHQDVCRLILEVSFAGARRINALVIHPTADVYMKIYSISYTDSGGQEVDLPIGSLYTGVTDTATIHSGVLGETDPGFDTWILPNRVKVIPVGDIVARSFAITLQQSSGIDGDFFYESSDLGGWVKKTSIEDFLQGQEGIDGQEIALELGFVDDSDAGRRQGRFEEFVFGLKEISALSREFETNGLFVPEPFELSKPPSVLALYTDADYPRSYRTDIEFLLRKENYDSTGLLLDVETIPFVPYGSTSVDERLFLSKAHVSNTSDDTGTFRFYPDFTQAVQVYRDDTLLTIGTDYYISVDEGVTFESTVPPTGTPGLPMKCQVRIVNPLSSAFYTAVYTPLVSSSSAGGEVWLNVNKTVRLGRDQTYVFNNVRPGGSVDMCKLAMQIIVRSNALNTRVSPYLKAAIILGG